MNLLICPGIHADCLTQAFLQALLPALPAPPAHLWVLPSGYQTLYVAQQLRQLSPQPPVGEPLSILAFSAGVVGVATALEAWQRQGGRVACLIALDGWGVPLQGKFPIYRLSHDYFTHWSSCWLGSGPLNFYADPAVGHLDLWKTPQQVWGWQLSATRPPLLPDPASAPTRRMTALTFICQALTTASIKNA
jgi:hypothetical protein